MIGIIDYGLGNIKAFHTVFYKESIDVKLIRSLNDFDEVDKIILPGVGAFDFAMTMLEKSGLLEKLNHKVLVDKTPVLGICVGMQIMAKSSDEGSKKGLGWLNSHVKKFDEKNENPLPHMGWNNLLIEKDDLIFKGIQNKSDFYFLHSYYLDGCGDDLVIGKADYGEEFTAVVRQDNIYGMQCHPEKSHQAGVQFLKNFAKI